MFCRKCGAQISGNARFCPKCGTEVLPMNNVAVNSENIAEKTVVEKKKNNRKIWIVLLIAIVMGIAVIGIIIAVRHGTEDKKPQEEEETVQVQQTESEVQSDTEEQECHHITIACKDAVYGTPLDVAQCTLSPRGWDNLYIGVYPSNGCYEMDIPYGEYALSLHQDGYYDISRVISFTEEGMVVQCNLIMELDSSRMLVLVEWEGKSDLDIGMFNAQTNAFIDGSNAYDTSGSFLYADHDATDGYELFSYNYEDGVYNFFVKDYTAMSSGSESTMLSDGVTVTVYSSKGEIYRIEGNHDMATPVWNPFYFYDGQLEPLDSYDFDYTSIDGLMRDKNQ